MLNILKSSGFYPLKSEIEIVRNLSPNFGLKFPFPHFWTQVPPLSAVTPPLKLFPFLAV